MTQKIDLDQTQGDSLTIGNTVITTTGITVGSTTVNAAGVFVSNEALTGGTGGATSYANTSVLPTTNLQAGQFAFANNNNTLYLTNGSGWYKIALINETPTITASIDSATLGYDPTSVLFTYSVAEPEGTPVTVTVSNSGISNTSVANVIHYTSNNTIRIDNFANTDYNATITLRASDGVNIGTDTVSINVQFALFTSNKLIEPFTAGDRISPAQTIDDDGNHYAAVTYADFTDKRYGLFKWDKNGVGQWALNWTTLSDRTEWTEGFYWRDGYLWLFITQRGKPDNNNQETMFIYKIDPSDGTFLNVWDWSADATLAGGSNPQYPTPNGRGIQVKPMSSNNSWAVAGSLGSSITVHGVLDLNGNTWSHPYQPKQYWNGANTVGVSNIDLFMKGGKEYMAVTGAGYSGSVVYTVDLEDGALASNIVYETWHDFPKSVTVNSSNNVFVTWKYSDTQSFIYKLNDNLDTGLWNGENGLYTRTAYQKNPADPNYGSSSLSPAMEFANRSLVCDDEYLYSLAITDGPYYHGLLLRIDQANLESFDTVRLGETLLDSAGNSTGVAQSLTLKDNYLLFSITEDITPVHSHVLKVHKNLNWVGQSFGNVVTSWANGVYRANTSYNNSLFDLDSVGHWTTKDANVVISITEHSSANISTHWTFSSNTGVYVAANAEWTWDGS